MLRSSTALTLLYGVMAACLQDLQRSFCAISGPKPAPPATLRLYGQAVTFLSRWLEAEGGKPPSTS